jgi:rod shape-determining protein MreC
MRNILNLIQRFYVFLLFLVLQGFAMYILFNSNNYHRATFVNHSRDWVGSIYSKRAQMREYLMLGEINDQLSRENAWLRSQLPDNFLLVDTVVLHVDDTLLLQKYDYRTAKVVNITLNRESNFIMIDRGSIGGIKKDMAVIANGNIVGKVTSVSDHFAVVMPVLHSKFVASVRMKGSGDLGLLVWQGGDPELATIKEIPKHVQVEIGDTVMTSGLAESFPDNVTVGYVSQMDDRAEENFHRITIRLSTDFRKLSHVQVINDKFRVEQDSLLNQSQITDGDNSNR